MNDAQYEAHKEMVTLIAFEDLRRRLIASCPEVQAQINQMAELIRELVKLEREKHGLDLRGTITLYPNKEQVGPDFTGSGRVGGRVYQAAAWIEGGKIRIALLPPERK